MSVCISKPFHNDKNAEWHKLEDCQGMYDDSYVVCMVCGEDIQSHQFAFGFKVDCPDCGIYLEVVKQERPNGDVDEFLVHYTDDRNENCAKEFYTRQAQ